MKMNKKGFTLIEMLVVIAIIAVLVAIVVPTVTSSTAKAKAAADAANLRSAMAEAQIYVLDKDVSTNKTFANTEVASVGTKSQTYPTETLAVTYDATTGKIVATFAEGHDLQHFIDIAGGSAD